MKIIFILGKQFREKILKTMGLDIMSKYAEISIFDVSSCLKSDADVNYQDSIQKFTQLTIIKKINDLEFELSNFHSDTTLVIVLSTDLKQIKPIAKLLKKYNLNYALKNTKSNPFNPHKIKNKIHTKSIIDNFLIDCFYKLKTWNILNSIIKLRWINIYKPKYFLVSTETTKKQINFYNKFTVFIKSHSDDYDKYLDFINKKYYHELCNYKYGLFIDQYIPFHNETKTFYKINLISAEYYSKISDFLLKLKEYLNLQKIIIALHPNANLEKVKPYFQAQYFSIISGKTLRYTAQSDIVVGHASTAFSYAILFNKPIMLIKTLDMKRTQYEYAIDEWANVLNRKPNLILSNKQDISNFDYGADQRAYLEYLKKYIKNPNTPDLKQWEIFLERVLKDYS